MTVWVDFSGTPPSGKSLVEAGVEGVLGYIGLGRESKQIHRAVHDDYVDHGLRMGLVAELGIDDAWTSQDDYKTGQIRADIALKDAQVDCPTFEFICCAADAHASSAAQINDAVAYAHGFSSILGFSLAGFYGFRETDLAVYNSGACLVHWRAGSEPTGSDREWVNFWQRSINNPGRPATGFIGGTKVDYDEVVKELNPMSGEADRLVRDIDAKLKRIQDATNAGQLDPKVTWPVINKGDYDIVIDSWGAAQRAEVAVKDLSKNIGTILTDYLSKNPITIPVEIDYVKLAKAVNDDADARARDNDPSTGPRT